MNGYETCLETLNDPETCGFAQATLRLAEALGLDGCLDENEPQRCLDACLENCQGENCRELCLGALDVAAAANLARRLIREAAEAAPKAGLTVPEAAAEGFRALLEGQGGDCAARLASMRVLGLVAIELRNLLAMQDLLLLLAPTVAKMHECLGDEALGLLDALAPAVGRETAERIAAALDKGAVKIGRVRISFPPVRPT
jgi:hypothetical protein